VAEEDYVEVAPILVLQAYTQRTGALCPEIPRTTLGWTRLP
jgi:hypothetical protein